MQNDSFTELRTELIGAEAGKRVAAALSQKPLTRDQIYYAANREKRRAYKKAYYAKNRERLIAKNMDWKRTNPEKTREYVRAATIKSRYGVTREWHEELRDAQDHRCAICGIEQSKLTRKLCVDHDHKTKAVRGLVCHHCNGVLGHARDRIDVLRSAILYLEKHQV